LYKLSNLYDKRSLWIYYRYFLL